MHARYPITCTHCLFSRVPHYYECHQRRKVVVQVGTHKVLSLGICLLINPDHSLYCYTNNVYCLVPGLLGDGTKNVMQNKVHTIQRK